MTKLALNLMGGDVVDIGAERLTVKSVEFAAGYRHVQVAWEEEHSPSVLLAAEHVTVVAQGSTHEDVPVRDNTFSNRDTTEAAPHAALFGTIGSGCAICGKTIVLEKTGYESSRWVHAEEAFETADVSQPEPQIDSDGIGLIDIPEVTARRGGIAFTGGPTLTAMGGWCAPSDTIYESAAVKPLTKKQLRTALTMAQKDARKAYKAYRKEQRKVKALLKIVEKQAGVKKPYKGPVEDW